MFSHCVNLRCAECYFGRLVYHSTVAILTIFSTSHTYTTILLPTFSILYFRPLWFFSACDKSVPKTPSILSPVPPLIVNHYSLPFLNRFDFFDSTYYTALSSESYVIPLILGEIPGGIPGFRNSIFWLSRKPCCLTISCVNRRNL